MKGASKLSDKRKSQMANSKNKRQPKKEFDLSIRYTDVRSKRQTVYAPTLQELHHKKTI